MHLVPLLPSNPRPLHQHALSVLPAGVPGSQITDSPAALTSLLHHHSCLPLPPLPSHLCSQQRAFLLVTTGHSTAQSEPSRGAHLLRMKPRSLCWPPRPCSACPVPPSLTLPCPLPHGLFTIPPDCQAPTYRGHDLAVHRYACGSPLLHICFVFPIAFTIEGITASRYFLSIVCFYALR